jgi:hypothetical protein
MAWIRSLRLLTGSKGVQDPRTLGASTDVTPRARPPETLAVDEIPSPVGPLGPKRWPLSRAVGTGEFYAPRDQPTKSLSNSLRWRDSFNRG